MAVENISFLDCYFHPESSHFYENEPSKNSHVFTHFFSNLQTLETQDHFLSHAFTAETVTQKENKTQKVFGDTLDHKGFSPLHEAIAAEDKACIEALLEGGLDPTLESKEGVDALSYAIYFGKQDIINIILEYYPTSKLLDCSKTSSALPLAKIKESVLYFQILEKLAKAEMLPSQDALKKLEAKIDQLFYAKMLPSIWSVGGFFHSNKSIESGNGNITPVSLNFLRQSIEAFQNYVKRQKEGKLKVEEKDMLEDDPQALNLASLAHYIPFEKVFQQELESTCYHNWNVDALVQKILAGETVLLPYSWPGHAISVVFAKIGKSYYLFKCNKGQSPIGTSPFSVYEISQANPLDLKKALSRLKRVQSSLLAASSYLYGILDHDLGLQLRCTHKFAPQKIGNCSWESLKLGFFSLIYVQVLKSFSQDPSRLTEKERKQIFQSAKDISLEIYKKWWSFSRYWVLKNYLENRPAGGVDKRLLYIIWKKVMFKKSSDHYQIFLKNAVQALFEEHKLLDENFHLQGLLEDSINLGLAHAAKSACLQGANPEDFASYRDYNLIALACKNGNLEVLKALISKADQLEYVSHNTKQNLLHIAAENKHSHILRYLLGI